MHDPAERADTDKPEDTRPDKKQDRGQEAALHQLPQPGNKKAGQRGDDVSGRTLSRAHIPNRNPQPRRVYPAKGRSRAKKSTTSG